MTIESDTPSGESGDLNVDGAAEAFAALLSDVVEEPSVDTEVDPPKKDDEEEELTPPEGVEEGDDAPITLEVDGKQVTLTKAQLADAYKNGLRQSDYTQKTMAVAEQRKAAEAETQKAQQERQTYAHNLTKMAAQLEGALQQQAQTDWDALLKNDPIQYLEQKALFEKRQAALNQNVSEQSRLAQQFQAEQTEATKTRLTEQHQKLIETLPQWKDEATASKERDAIKADLLKRGYTAEDVAGIQDHKAVVMAREAMLYRQMMAKANAAAKKMQSTPEKVVRPGVSAERGSNDGRSAAARSHAQRGTVDSAAEFFKTIL